ncbi:hypothetical protein KUCAC02_008503, partial [Chaenocephalus aceratus]
KDRQRKRRQHSSSRERGVPKRSQPSREKRDEERDGQHEEGAADSDKPHKRKKKRKWHSAGEMEEQGSCHSQSQSPPRYQSYESDHYSDKLEIDVLSLDGEALDSDYPYLEDTPPAALPPEQTIASPKTKTIPKTGRHHPKKKSYTLKKMAKSQSSSSNKTKSKCLSSLTVTTGPASTSSGLPSTKRARKVVKAKNRDKGSRKDLSHSGKSKKESGVSRKGKLQSKVSVLVREGVSSTTGASVGSGKLGMDLMGPGGTGGGAGSSAVGGSIAVVFCRDNESRSPFLKPCSEPLSRSKDMASMGKRSSLAAPPSSLSSPSGLKLSISNKPHAPGIQSFTPAPPPWTGVSIALSAPTAKPPSLDDAPKLLASPPCSSSTASCGPTSISLSSADPSSSVSSSSASKPHPPPESSALPWSLQTGVDCTTGGVLALTALLFKMEEANIASRAKAQEFIQATSQILSQANQSQAQQLAPPSSSSHIPPPPSLPLHSDPALHHAGGLTGSFGDTDWDLESKDPDKYLKKLHTQERAVEEVKLAIKPYYQRKDINKDEYKTSSGKQCIRFVTAAPGKSTLSKSATS